MEKQTVLLSKSLQQFTYSLTELLSYQISLAESIEDVYADSENDVKRIEQYHQIIKALQTAISSELDHLNMLIPPIETLMSQFSAIRRVMSKRSRKQLDLDRFTEKSNSNSAEKAQLAAQNDLEIAEYEFGYYNDMLKRELPNIISIITQDFAGNIFSVIYYGQLNIYYMMYTEMKKLVPLHSNTSVSNADVIFDWRRQFASVREQTEQLGITKYRLDNIKIKLDTANYISCNEVSHENDFEKKSMDGYRFQLPPQTKYANPSSPTVLITKRSNEITPPPPPVPRKIKSETCVALYDYVPQASGDLPLKAGQVIEILERTETDGWWTGRIDGEQGIFPGNYVQLS